MITKRTWKKLNHWLDSEVSQLRHTIVSLQRDNNFLMDAMKHLARMHSLDFVPYDRTFFGYPDQPYGLIPLVEDPPPDKKAISHPKEVQCK